MYLSVDTNTSAWLLSILKNSGKKHAKRKYGMLLVTDTEMRTEISNIQKSHTTYLELLQSKRALAEILDGERDEHGHGVLGGDHQVDHVVGDELVGELVVVAAAYEHVDGVARGPGLALTAVFKDGPPPPPPLVLYDPLYQPGHPLLGLAVAGSRVIQTYRQAEVKRIAVY